MVLPQCFSGDSSEISTDVAKMEGMRVQGPEAEDISIIISW